MDLQTFLDNTVAAERSKTLAQSDQLTLGELILKCENIASKGYSTQDGEEPTVRFDFEYLYPTNLDSWRGSYNELALGFADGADVVTISSFLNTLKGALGKTFTGYKGGDYLMSKHTPVWVANYGNGGNTTIIEVVGNSYEIILMTAYREF